MSKLRIYKLERKEGDNGHYDSFISAVVYAFTEQHARYLHPYYVPDLPEDPLSSHQPHIEWEHDRWVYTLKHPVEGANKWLNDNWIPPADVKVTLLGQCLEDGRPHIIIAHFRHG